MGRRCHSMLACMASGTNAETISQYSNVGIGLKDNEVVSWKADLSTSGGHISALFCGGVFCCHKMFPVWLDQQFIASPEGFVPRDAETNCSRR